MSEQAQRGRAHSCIERASVNKPGKWSFACACHSSGHASRRQFLAGAAAFGATAVLPAAKTPAHAATQKLIDTHHHFYPPAYQKAWSDWEDQRKIPHFGVQLAWTRDKDIEEMDKNGVTTSILSLASTPGVWFDTDAKAAHDMARLVLRFRRRDGAEQAGPLRPVRAAVDARCRL